MGLPVDPARAGSAIILSTLVMSLASLTVTSEASHRLERQRLVRELHRLLSLRASFGERVAQSERDLQRQIHVELDPALARIDSALATAEDDGRAATIIDAVGRIVRPMSHRLAGVEAEDPAVPFLAVPQESQAHRQPVDVRRAMMPGAVAGVTLALSLAYLVSGPRGIWPYLPTAALVLSSGFATLAVVSRWWPRALRCLTIGPTVGALAAFYAIGGGVASAVLGIIGPLTLGGAWSSGVSPMSHNATWPLTASLVVGMGLSALSLAEQRLQQAENDLRDVNEELDIMVSRLRAQLWVNRQRMSWVLHGPIQSALIAAAYELQHREVTAQDRERLRNRIATAAAHLESTEHRDHGLDRAIDELSALWEFTCPLDVTASAATRARLQRDPTASSAVIEILREGMSNAVRHGSATRVSVDLALTDTGLLAIRIADNGVGLAAAAPTGLGSTLMDQVCHRWERTDTGHGVVVAAQITLA